MQDPKQEKDAQTSSKVDARKSEATSEKTLSDIEETESDLDSTLELDPGPSPDGALDEPDELKDAGPM